MPEFELKVAASAERQLATLPGRFASAIVEFLTGPLLDEPFRVGKPLRGELAGYMVARRGAYRVVYRVEPDPPAVIVVRIDHRSDVYRRP